MMNKLRTIAILVFLTIMASRVHAQEQATLEPDMVYVNAVAWSHDGSKIAVVGIRQPAVQGYLRVLDVQTGETLYAFDPSPGGFTSVAWSPDDRFIAAGGYDQVVWVFDVNAHEHAASLWGHRATVTDVVWNADGTQLVSSGNWDGLTILWDMINYVQIRPIEANDLFPLSVAFSPDNHQIAIGGEGGIRIYPSNNDSKADPSWYFRELRVGSLAWSHNSKRLVFGTQVFPSVINPNRKTFAQLYMIDSGTGAELSRFTTEDQTIYGIAWSADDTLITTSSIDGVVRVWDAASGKLLDSYNSGMTRYGMDVSFSPYGGRLAYGGMLSGEVAASTEVQSMRVQDGIQTLAGGAIQIVVPAPSVERLEAIAEQCNAPAPLESALTARADDAALTDFVAQVEALPADQLDPACAADLIAVAEALAAQP